VLIYQDNSFDELASSAQQGKQIPRG